MISLAGECEHAPSLPFCDLRQNVRRRAEAVETERLALARHTIAAPADQSGAEPRCDRRVLTILAERKTKARIGDRMVCETTVTRITGEYRRIAKIFAIAAAIRAGPACATQPRHADAFDYRKTAHAGRDRHHTTDNLVAGHYR